MENRKAGKKPPEGYVQEYFLVCYDGPALVGVFSLKLELTPYLLAYGGHVGYAVRPDRRYDPEEQVWVKRYWISLK